MFPRVALRLGILPFILVTLACTTAVAPSTEPQPTTTVSPQPTIAVTPEPSTSPPPSTRPPLRYPESQSYGVATITFVTPALDPVMLDIACEWSSPTQVGYFTFPDRAEIGGEEVDFELNPRTTVADSLVYIGRGGAASYLAGNDTGRVSLGDHAGDWLTGRIDFEDLAPNPETAPPGPLPSPLEDWIRPLGGDPANARLSGAATWACEPAPATVQEPEPVPSEAPERTMPPLPSVVLVSGDQRDRGERLCGSFDIDGYAAGDSCGIGFVWAGPEHTVRVRAGDRLRFEAPKGWHFTGWAVGWATQAEAERYRFERPDSFVEVDHGKATDGRVLEVEAPPVGEWDVALGWTIERGDDTATYPSFFRVLVED